MKGAMTTMVLVYGATAGGAEDFVGSRWVRTQGIRAPSHQSAFVAIPAPGASAVSWRLDAGLSMSSTPQNHFEERSHLTGFFARANAKSRKSMTTVMASPKAGVDQPQVDLKPDCDADDFSCRNAFFFAKMSQTAYSTKQEVETFFKGNDTVTGLGFEHFKWFEAPKELSEKSVFDGIQDTEAYVAANDDLIMAVFRGTKELTDWTTNLNAIPKRVPDTWGLEGEGCDVHEGFDEGVDTVWHGENGMYEAIKSLYEEDGKSRKLYIAGHSLGGALATIAAARLAFVDDMNISGMYTIGSPRVFDGQLSEIFDNKVNHGKSLKDKYFRCRNNNDIVPKIMPPPYEHVGTEVYLDSKGNIKPPSIWDSLSGRYDAYTKFDFSEDIDDHSASEYIRIFERLAADDEGGN